MSSDEISNEAIDIQKGIKVDIQKVAPGLRVARICAIWDANKSPNGAPFDLDLSVVSCNAEGKAIGVPAFVFYSNMSNSNGSIIVTRDERSGESEGYDEEAYIKFDEIPADVKTVYACVSIAFFITRKQNFGQIKNAKIDMYDDDTREKLITFDLSEDMSAGTGCLCIRFMREADGSWSYKALGEIVDGGLKGVLEGFGFTVIGDE